MTPALLSFSIGPVQDFIATARRTQDWWMKVCASLAGTAILALIAFMLFVYTATKSSPAAKP